MRDGYWCVSAWDSDVSSHWLIWFAFFFAFFNLLSADKIAMVILNKGCPETKVEF